MDKTNKRNKFWPALIIFSLAGQIAWVVENMYLNVFIYKMFNASPSDISLMVAASAIAATVTTVLMGGLSDKIGKRKLFICAGYILWGVSILGFACLRTDVISPMLSMSVTAASVGISLTIALDCIMTFFGSTANDAAFNAWLTDSADQTNRGAAEGLNAVMPLIAMLAVFGGFMGFDLASRDNWSIIFTIIGVVVLAVGVLGFFIIKEPNIKPVKIKYTKSLLYGFLPSTVKANPTLYVLFAAFILFNVSIQIFMPYLLIYYEISLAMADYVLILAPAVILASVFTALWGKLYDKKGFFSCLMISLILLLSGYAALFALRDTAGVFIGSLLMMCGYLASMAVFGAAIRSKIPKGASGMLQGARICSQVLLPGVIGPYIGAAVLANAQKITNNDGTESFIPNANIFLAAFAVALAVIPFVFLLKNKIKPEFVRLTTPFEKDISDIPFSDYPRPLMERDSYLCLNGKWELTVLKGTNTLYEGNITVPYPPESRLSKVEKEFPAKSTLIYQRTFTLPQGFMKDKLLLHFGAVDQLVTVLINHKIVSEQDAVGITPFSIDITNFITDGQNTLTVIVHDPLDPAIPYGKQRKKRGGMWYTPISGIWQTVWLESVPENHIEGLRITGDLSGVSIEVTGGKNEKSLTVSSPDGIKHYKFEGDSYRLDIENPRLWCPDDPYLYRFELTSGKDTVRSYFALRTVGTVQANGKKLLALNGKPFFFHGLLDQGYYSDGIYLPTTSQGYVNDIISMKACGFNTLRKHIKLEPDIFYYYCDLYGMLVFQDMINNGKYSFLVDTALPTLGKKSGISHKADERTRDLFIDTSKKIIRQLYNHPCVCYYTVFNEGWGQFDADQTYQLLKAQDGTRIFDATSGWFFETKSDVDSHHVYFKPIDLKYEGRPLVLSEFGGYSYPVPDHRFNVRQNYGYKLFNDQTTFQNALSELYCQQIIPAIKNGLCCSILTQVSDVEDETNGLLTYDRQILKADAAKMQETADLLLEAFNKANNE